MTEELMAPKSIEDEEFGAEMETVEEREVQRGQPSSYTGPETRCGFCLHFREFYSPACKKHGFGADPDGYCDDFEGRKEDSSGTTEESYGNMEGEDDAEDEAEDEE